MEIHIGYGTSEERTLTEAQKSTVWNALLVARDRYRDDAAEMLKAGRDERAAGNEAGYHGFGRLAEQFDRQARDADTLIETFE